MTLEVLEVFVVMQGVISNGMVHFSGCINYTRILVGESGESDAILLREKCFFMPVVPRIYANQNAR